MSAREKPQASIVKFNVFFDEFPFLKRYIKENSKYRHVRVARIDQNLLNIQVYPAKWNRHYIFLVDKDGNQIAEVGKMVKSKDVEKGLFKKRVVTQTKEHNIDGESVHSALRRIGDKAQDVHYIVVLYSVNVEDIYSDDYDIIVYKQPKHHTGLTDFLKQEEDKTKAALYAEESQMDNARPKPSLHSQFCIECGQELHKNAKFCSRCGSKIECRVS